MSRFVLRKNQRFKKSFLLQYRGEGILGEGRIKDLSLGGGQVAGAVPVSKGMTLALRITLPEEPELLVIEKADVKWVKGLEFGLDFGMLDRKVSERITKVISELVKKHHG